MPDNQLPGLSIVLPAYNEGQIIITTLNQIHGFLSHWEQPFEVIVVNDGSKDGTGALVKSFSEKHPIVRLLEHPTNRGYGEALRSGFNAARHEWILLMDSDGQLDINDLNNFWPLTNDYQVIIGYRSIRSDPWYRILFTRLYMLLLWFCFRLRVRDVGCGFKLFKRSTWQTVQPIQSHDHKIFSVEWILKLDEAGIAIKELPVTHHPRKQGRPTGAKLNVIWQTLRAMTHLWLNIHQPVEW